MNELNWLKVNNLMPAIIQHAETGQVLMLGYMNQEALTQTQETRLVTFYSRTKKRLWVKGEESGHVLSVVSIESDCDQDSLLVFAIPKGPTCHLGQVSCFNGSDRYAMAMISRLDDIIAERLQSSQQESYCYQIAQQGVKRAAQKVGEEGVEVALAAMSSNQLDFINESADLLFHMQLLWQIKGVKPSDVMAILRDRHSQKTQ